LFIFSVQRIFAARRYASAVYAVVVSAYLSQAGIAPKRLGLGSWKQRLTVAQMFSFSDAKDFGEISLGSTLTERPNTGGAGLNLRLSTSLRYISETVQR